MNPSRHQILRDLPLNSKGEYILYRMQASVRLRHNFALRYAVEQANDLEVPLRILYTLDPDFPEANLRHFRFLVEGLLDFSRHAVERGYQLMVEIGSPEAALRHHLPEATLVVLDKGYLRIQRSWQEKVCQLSVAPVYQIEDNLVVPVALASDKAEWAARTIRPRIHRALELLLEDALYELPALLSPQLQRSFDRDELCEKLNRFLNEHPLLDRSLPPISMVGGEEEAGQLFRHFVANQMIEYAEARNDPAKRASSRISPYLHFGQIAPLTLLQLARKGEELVDDRLIGRYQDSLDMLVEQLVVRRELAHNYVYYRANYDCYEALPEWTRRTLAKHASDPRPVRYTLQQLIACATHELAWNAAMRELITTGFMENTLRMYWGKKILEWSDSPAEAFALTLYLNNRYLLDGRDANSFVGVAWCFGLHDRPWVERPIFGMVRYMNEVGLYRKYDMKRYIAQWGLEALSSESTNIAEAELN